jgi:adenine C2-methylase RlmN of 23S rRNA A2503 and tRNA A37
LSNFNILPISDYEPCPSEKAQSFYRILINKNCNVKFFRSIGTKVGTGCGQIGFLESQLFDKWTINCSELKNEIVASTPILP